MIAAHQRAANSALGHTARCAGLCSKAYGKHLPVPGLASACLQHLGVGKIFFLKYPYSVFSKKNV